MYICNWSRWHHHIAIKHHHYSHQHWYWILLLLPLSRQISYFFIEKSSTLVTTPDLTTMNVVTSPTTDGVTTSLMTTTTDQTNSATLSPSIFIPPSCPNRNQMGIHCNISAMPCNILKPCQNNGTCIDNNTISHGYTCSCPSGFNGTNCEIDIRPCKPHTCRNNGTSTSFIEFHLNPRLIFFFILRYMQWDIG